MISQPYYQKFCTNQELTNASIKKIKINSILQNMKQAITHQGAQFARKSHIHRI